MAVERIAERHGLSPWKKRFHGLTCEGAIAGKRVVLLKPQTYMNDSGRSVGEACRYLKIAEGDIYVFHDELDLAPSKLKLKTGRRQRRAQWLALHLGAYRQRICPRAHRHRPSGLQGAGPAPCTARLRQGRRGLARAAARCDRRRGTAARRRRRRALPHRRGAHAEGRRGGAQAAGAAPRAARRSPHLHRPSAIPPASARTSAPVRWPRTSSDG